MKKDLYTFDKSSFLTIEKNFSIIINKILSDNKLKKLLYYPTKDCLEKDNLTQEQTLELIDKNYIKIVPKLLEEEFLKNYLVITFGNFTTCQDNPEYRNCIITFSILSNFDQWQLGNYKLRPYKIAGRIDALFNNQKLNNIGKVNFLTGDQIILNESVGGLTLMYSVIYSGEDNFYPLGGE